MGGLTASSAPGPRKRSLFTTLRDGRLSRRHWSARAGRGAQYQARLEWCNDARTGMPPGMPGGAMCVRRFDDSLNSAIHITYRISLRSSSMPEPRDPLLKVLIDYMYHSDARDARVMKVSAGGPDARRPGRPRGNRVVSTWGWREAPERHTR